MSMSEQEIRKGALELLRAMERKADEGDAQEEHVIIVCDPRVQREHAIGVYENRAAALAGLVNERDNYLKADPEFADLTYRLVPMFRGLHEKEQQ